MGIIAKPHTFADDGTVSHSEWNANFDTVYTEVNGLLDDSNFKPNANLSGSKLANSSITAAKLASAAVADSKLDYSSVKVIRTGPNISGNGIRLARGTKAFTLAAGTVNVTITFSSDAADGNPSFTASPVMGFGIETSGTNRYTVRITAKSSSAVTVKIDSSSGADTSSGTLHWRAEGNA